MRAAKNDGLFYWPGPVFWRLWFAGLLMIFCLLYFLTSALPAERCKASWYEHGARTANGERFKPDGLTAAHRSYPFGTWLGIRARNGRKITVRVNDRGPFVGGRCIDLARGAAVALGIKGSGVQTVEIKKIR